MSIAGSLDSLFNTEPWVEQSVCSQTDPEVFFPEKGSTTTDAKSVCAVCPVRARFLGGSGECLDYALRRGERFGIWGGLSERERRGMRHPISQDPDGLYCGNGHSYARVGKRGDGSCAECRRIQNRRYKRWAS